MEKNPQKFIQQLIKTYRLTVIDKSNFVEVYNTSVSKLKIGTLVLSIFLVSLALVVLVIFFTPLKRTVPGYPSSDLHNRLLSNAVKVDSLERELQLRDNYLDQIRKVIKGEIVNDEVDSTEAMKTNQVTMAPMHDDSIFSDLIGPDKYKFSYLSTDEDNKEISHLNFFTPISGVVTNKFKTTPSHFGTDIVAKENSFIAAVLDGTVIFAEWSVTTGYVVQIQHSYNLISIYKHNSDVLVKPGEQVKAGTVIAIMGNEGEYSTGPHLHFELWQNGVPLNPQQYITF